jgi:hypothetical protein
VNACRGVFGSASTGYVVSCVLDNLLNSNNTDPPIKSELLHWYEIITRQIYFQHNDKTITPIEGLEMGAPSSSIISELFLQHIEHTHTPPPPSPKTQTH